MPTLAEELRSRFPLLTDLEVQITGQAEQDYLPPFIGLLLAAIDAPNPACCCFVLPRKEEVGRLLATLYALGRLKKEFPNLLSGFHSALRPGDYVRIAPGTRVFKFCGPSQHNEGHLCLECKPQRGSLTAFTGFPKSLASRLVKVSATKITGTFDHCLFSEQRPPIDSLLGIHSYGNLSFAPNYVLVLDTQTQFESFSQNTFLRRPDGRGTRTPVADLGVFGLIDEDGTLTRKEAGTPGQPIIAVTSSVESLTAACTANAANRPKVLIHELRLLKSPQFFDAIAERSDVIVIAETAEMEAVSELRQRNCKIWPFGKEEIELGLAPLPHNNGRPGFFKNVLAASHNAHCLAEPVPCECPALESVSLELEALNRLVQGDGNDELRAILTRLFGLLNSASALLLPLPAPATADFVKQIERVRAELSTYSHWIPVTAQTHVTQACLLLAEFFSQPADFGRVKRENLRTLLQGLSATGRAKLGVLTKREQHFESIRAVARQAGVRVTTFTAQPALLPDAFFDAVICVNWPGSDAFQRFSRRYMAPEIKFLGYPFELRWLRQCRQKMRREVAIQTVTQEDKSSILHLQPSVTFTWPQQPSDPADPLPTTTDFSIISFEKIISSSKRGSGVSQNDPDEKVRAKYVELAGGKFAFMMENHKLPVATSLVLSPDTAPQKLPEKDVADWKVGDYVVFFESGDREVLKEVADRLMGVKAHTLRERARIWKLALESCGFSAAEIRKRLAEVGCRRTMVTVRNWVGKASQIGPEEKSDLEAIAAVTQSLALQASIESVWSAIQEIWSYHQRAGSVLRRILAEKLPSVRLQIEEHGTEVQIEDQGKHLGSATIVTVERIDTAFELCSRSLVNRLRSEEKQLPLYI